MSEGMRFAGEPVLLDVDGQLQRYVADKWPNGLFPSPGLRQEFRPIGTALLGADIGSRIQSPYGDWPDPRLNELVIPTGASRWAKGLIAVTRDSLSQIAQKCFGYKPPDDEEEQEEEEAPPAEGESEPEGGEEGSEEPAKPLEKVESWGDKHEPAELVFEWAGETFTRSLYPLTPIPLDRINNDLWLLPLVDERYYWQWEDAGVSVSTDTMWEEVFHSLGLEKKEGLLHPDVETLQEFRGPKGVLADAVALSSGYRIVMAEDGPELQDAKAAKPLVEANFKMARLELGNSVPAYPLPKSLQLVYREAQDYSGECKKLKTKDFDFEEPGTKPETLRIPTTFWFNVVNGEPTPGSIEKLETLGKKLRDSIKSWSEQSYCGSVAGAAAWEMSGFDDYLSIGAYRVDGRMRVGMSVTGASPLLLPVVQLGQQKEVYVHPAEIAEFVLYETLRPGGKVKATLKKVASFTDGSVTKVYVGHPLKSGNGEISSGSTVFAQFQCGSKPPWQVLGVVNDMGGGGTGFGSNLVNVWNYTPNLRRRFDTMGIRSIATSNDLRSVTYIATDPGIGGYVHRPVVLNEDIPPWTIGKGIVSGHAFVHRPEGGSGSYVTLHGVTSGHTLNQATSGEARIQGLSPVRWQHPDGTTIYDWKLLVDLGRDQPIWRYVWNISETRWEIRPISDDQLVLTDQVPANLGHPWNTDRQYLLRDINGSFHSLHPETQTTSVVTSVFADAEGIKAQHCNIEIIKKEFPCSSAPVLVVPFVSSDPDDPNSPCYTGT